MAGTMRTPALMACLALLLVIPVVSGAPLVGTPEIVNLAHHGDLPDRTTHDAAVDDAGRFVAFSSFASDVVPDQPAGCQASERDTCILLYVTDRTPEDGGEPRTWMVTNSDGEPPDDSVSSLAMSGDGRSVLFETEASNLVPGDTNGVRDIYAYDVPTGTLERITTCLGGERACGGGTYAVGVSHDGRFVSFASASPELAAGDEDDAPDVFVRDRLTGVTERVSLGPEGQETAAYAEQRYGRGISDDGRMVVFGTLEQDWSDAFDPECQEQTGSHSTGPCRHLWVFDRDAGTSRPLGLGPDNVRSESGPFLGFLSGDGTRVAYGSVAPVLDADDPERQAYIETIATGEVRMVSTSAAGEAANAPVWLRAATKDLRYVMLQTAATNLVADESVAGEHVYVKDVDTGTVWRLATPELPHMDVLFMEMGPDLEWVSFLAHPADQQNHHVMTQKVFGLVHDLGEGAPAKHKLVGPDPAPLDMPMESSAVPDPSAGPASTEPAARTAPLPIAWAVAALALAASIRRKG